MPNSSLQDRAAGAIMGAFIGDALGLGPHWYYDLEELRRDYGEWIEDYTAPKEDRYHAGMSAGEQSQSGIILGMLIDSVLAHGGYDEADFCARLDQDLFPLLDGTAKTGPGGFTSQSIREAWALRTQANKPWGAVAGYADNTEAAERALCLAVALSGDPAKLAEAVWSNTKLTQCDVTVQAMTVAYGAVLGMLVQGHALDGALSGKLMGLVGEHKLPYHAVTIPNAPGSGPSVFPSPDALLSPSNIARAAKDDVIKPAWKASLVYGMPCAVYHQFPSCYYLSARFQDDFEAAVLNAINGGGQNMARAMLTGALVGAQVGLGGIPKRLIDGLAQSGDQLARARGLARLL